MANHRDQRTDSHENEKFHNRQNKKLKDEVMIEVRSGIGWEKGSITTHMLVYPSIFYVKTKR